MKLTIMVAVTMFTAAFQEAGPQQPVPVPNDKCCIPGFYATTGGAFTCDKPCAAVPVVCDDFNLQCTEYHNSQCPSQVDATCNETITDQLILWKGECDLTTCTDSGEPDYEPLTEKCEWDFTNIQCGVKLQAKGCTGTRCSN